MRAAFLAVPRHLFTPGEPLHRAYANDIVVTRTDSAGMPTSSVSAPGMQAVMLEQAQVRPGMRVLEIGSGGYNAALLAELAGPAGQVVTADIDPQVTARARDCLARAGYPQVTVMLADREYGVPGHAPYDRIIVTAGAWDIPRAGPTSSRRRPAPGPAADPRADPVRRVRAAGRAPGQPQPSVVRVRAGAGRRSAGRAAAHAGPQRGDRAHRRRRAGRRGRARPARPGRPTTNGPGCGPGAGWTACSCGWPGRFPGSAC